MGAVGAQARLNACGRLAVAVGDEVVGVAPRHGVVGLEVAVAHHVVVVALEQRHLCAAGRHMRVSCSSLRLIPESGKSQDRTPLQIPNGQAVLRGWKRAAGGHTQAACPFSYGTVKMQVFAFKKQLIMLSRYQESMS